MLAFPCVCIEWRFEPLFKHSTIPCITDRLSTILVALEDGPVKFTRQRQRYFTDKGMLLNFLVLGDDGVFPLHAMTFACTFTVVHPRFVACARLRKASCPDFALYVVHVRKSAV